MRELIGFLVLSLILVYVIYQLLQLRKLRRTKVARVWVPINNFSDKIDGLLDGHIELAHMAGEPVPDQSVLIMASESWANKEIPGVTVYSQIGNIFAAVVTEEGVKLLDNDPDVQYVEWAGQTMTEETEEVEYQFSDKFDPSLAAFIQRYPAAVYAIIVGAQVHWDHSKISGLDFVSQLGNEFRIFATKSALRELDLDPNVNSVGW